MSTRGSTAPDEDAARRAAERERRQPPVANDPHFDAVRRGRTGRPALVSAPDGTPSYWIVPFVLEDRVSGFALIDREGRAVQVATFGGGPADSASWPDVAFFERPPAALVTGARSQYPDLRLEGAMLSYDGSPSKWGWRIESGLDDGTLLFLTPTGWYARPPRSIPDAAREG